MYKPKTTEHTILCECGHPLSHHSFGAGECYVSTRRTEKRKNHTGELVKVKCVYVCYCKKFNLGDKDSQSVHNTKLNNDGGDNNVREKI